ncbi:lysylphosphatidylglycerol synthase transmembrane domain-containing protein [Spongiactinospora sp. TRM90649]|uniref:lysylphosphatidylglycerol synthase transmembrane domain-containing protein n=1 Tax=Spongiactinospora sp. TRM90649 TaxID=3031114 RepID=UPI0023FA10E9|nr:lysylphosphatidylglycerol synthase transmembrane domain-containing protein [Spongiactinospora sp. TRM90649]MDF5757275.1 lysylphosphatidylglycerol synthase transmembrane domain-containing protein [Spongiactinospora sp. TRM90649]
MKNTRIQILLSVVSLGLAAGLIVFLPQVVGALTDKEVSWAQIGSEFAQMSPLMVLLMSLTWLASLAAYTVVLTSSLPGLTHPQALTLNAGSSAVSNLLPFGGALGVALTFAMTKGWGFPFRAVVVSTLTTGIWNNLFRFILPAVGILALLLAGRVPDQRIAQAGWVGALSILTLVAIVALALYWDRAAALLGRGLDGFVRVLPHRLRPREHAASEALTRLRADTAGIVRRRWPGLTIGMIAFMGFQWLIMICCLQATGAYPGLAESIAVFALSRVLTTALVTPSGAGIMELGVLALLNAFGVPLPAATAAALLFGFWTYTIEIPFGGLALGAWSLLRRRDGRAGRPSGRKVEEAAHVEDRGEVHGEVHGDGAAARE